jgi:hypothetical protein
MMSSDYGDHFDFSLDEDPFVGVATLPDGHQVTVSVYGYTESDTNAFVETSDSVLTWVETGEELTVDEMNQIIMHDGQVWYLHEFVEHNAPLTR